MTTPGTYVLIPGAGGAAWYWHRVSAELRERGHEVVPVDLPADDDTAGLTEYTDSVVDAVGQRLDLVLVAQSMGGFTAPMACQRLPVSLLVLVNAMVPRPGETAGQWWANTGQPEAQRSDRTRPRDRSPNDQGSLDDQQLLLPDTRSLTSVMQQARRRSQHPAQRGSQHLPARSSSPRPASGTWVSRAAGSGQRSG